MTDGLEPVLQEAKALDYVAPEEDGAGSDAHYNFFESLLTGRDMHSTSPASDKYREMFKAQVIKDASMAHRVVTLMDEADKEGAEDDVFLVLCEQQWRQQHGRPFGAVR